MSLMVLPTETGSITSALNVCKDKCLYDYLRETTVPYKELRRSSLSVCVYVMSILSLVSHGFNCQKVAKTKYFVTETTFFDTADLFLTCFYPP